MGKEYYCRQKFIFTPMNNEVCLDKYYTSKPEFLQNYSEQINLFDDDNISRSIDISELDFNIDTQSDFETLICQIKHVTTLYILDTRKKIDNPIISKFQEKTLRAYIFFFEHFGINCKIVLSIESNID